METGGKEHNGQIIIGIDKRERLSCHKAIAAAQGNIIFRSAADRGGSRKEAEGRREHEISYEAARKE